MAQRFASKTAHVPGAFPLYNLLMRIALAQINPLIGDLEGNTRKIRSYILRAAQESADLVLFPELCICGYPPKDLLLKSRFIEENLRALQQLASEIADGPMAVVGFVDVNEQPVGRRLFNAVALLQNGTIAARCHKSLLPTYDVFDEHRYFEPSDATTAHDVVIAGQRLRIGLTICEDLWNDKRVIERPLYHRNPIEELSRAGVNLVLNSSASPFVAGKQAFREKLMGGQAAAHKIPVAYVNQVGGNDELVFDGASCFFDAQGKVLARARAFEEDLVIVESSGSGHSTAVSYPDQTPSIWQALVLGTRDYVGKCGFKDVVIGLSGGIDSALTAAIAAEALGAAHVYGVGMPSRYSSDHSIEDARVLAENLGIHFELIPIQKMHAALESDLVPHFGGKPPDTTEENIQARLRGNILMSLSNKFGRLLLTTGNKSELAVGYCTLYGDMCGGLAVISDVPKTLVYELAHYRNKQAGRDVIPQRSITKLPSAELRPDQYDQQSLPPYDMLDAILHEYIELEKSAAQIAALSYDEKIVRDVIRKVDGNEYKRKQAATGLKVTSRAFGVGRRMPIAAKF
jgi:NAD+ synthase (glutamine-hydrolysing)